MKKHNFNAGPSILPRVAIENAAKAILDFEGIGLSLLEISHRTKDFEAVNDEAEALFRELLHIPDNYKVLFLQGGGSTQFAMIPLNLMKKKKIDICVTGQWAKKAAQEAEKRTGVHIEYSHPATTATQEQFNLLVASGNLPDIMWYNSNSAKYTGGMDALIDDGIFLDLTDYLQYMPNYVAAMKRNEETGLQCKTDTGRYAVAWMLNVEKEWDWGGPLVRKDWLEDCGLDTPVTYDDWYEMLKAFKEQKGATVPMLTGAKEFYNMLEDLNAGYGVTDDFINKDGKATYAPILDDYKDFMKLMNQWYAEGLIDPEFMTRDTQDQSTMANDQTGVHLFGVWTFPSIFEAKYGQEWVPVPYPVKSEGEVAHLGWQQYEICSDALGITTSCKDPVLAAKWIDYFYSEEGSLLKNYGIEGETFEYIDGEPQLNDEVRKAKADGTKSGYDYLGVALTGIYDWKNSLYGNDEKNLVCYDVWDASTDGSYVMPPISMTSDEGTNYSAIMGDITTYVQECTVKFITGAMDVDKEWDNYVSQIQSMGIEQATEYQQAALDRYFAR